MSVTVVSDKHISALVNVFSEGGIVRFWHDGPQELTLREAGQILLNENYYSYDARYGHKGEDNTPHKFRLTFETHDPIQLLKAWICYDYNACESPNWKTSLAKAMIDYNKMKIIRLLPGYKEAAWEI